MRRDGHRGAAARRQLVGGRLRGRRGQDPLRPERGEERGGDGGAEDRRARARVGRSRRSGTSPSASTRRSSTSARSSRSSSAAPSTRPARRGWGCSPSSSRRSRTDRSSRRTGSWASRRSSTASFDAAESAVVSHHPPVPTAEFEKQELLRLEKETLGLYVSEHPLSGVRDQLRRKADATLAELERRRDGEVVTVGGIVSRGQAADDEEGRPDGLPHARRPDRHGRGRRLQLRLPGRARALRGRPDPDRQGARRPQAAGRDEARRDRGCRLRGRHGAARGAVPARRARGARRRDPRARAGSCASSPASRRSTSRSTRPRARRRTPSARSTASARTRTFSPRRARLLGSASVL